MEEKRLRKSRWSKEYYRKNRRRILAQVKLYQQRNRRRVLAHSKIYRQRNLKIILEYGRRYRRKNRKRLNEYIRFYRKLNRKAQLKRQRRYYRKNKCRIQAYSKLYQRWNRKAILECNRRYREKNKERVRQYTAEYLTRPYVKKRVQRQRRVLHLQNRNKPEYIILRRLRVRLYAAMSRAGVYKSAPTARLIGCSLVYFVRYLEKLFLPGMTWSNRRKWHIDHIKPCASFDLTDHEQQKQCFHYTNMQPLWAVDNLRKGDRVGGVAF